MKKHSFTHKNISKPSVAVAVCAYNEEKNITRFLSSVLSQNTGDFKLEEILVVSDGSDDRTNELVEKSNSKLINFVCFKDRAGKSRRLNYIYRNVESDILLQFDSDVVLSGKDVFKNMVKKFVDDKDLMMLGGNAKPVKGRTFVKNSVNKTTNAYQTFRKEINEGDNPFSVDGRILGYRKKLYKTFDIPQNMIANDRYTYYHCISRGMKYGFVPEAVVKYRSPSTLHDHIKQNTRFIAANIRMKNYFSPELLSQKTEVPKGLFLSSLINEALRSPVECLFVFLVNVYCALKAVKDEKAISAKWDIAGSTKLVNR